MVPVPIETLDAVRVKVGTYTPSVMLVVAVWVPETPVMVSGYCPVLAALVAANVKELS